VKNDASQLTMMLANAEDNLQDPEFQTDMLLTVRASADRINTLITRLRQPGEVMPETPQPSASAAAGAASFAPLERLQALVADKAHPVRIEEDAAAPSGLAAMAPEPFDEACGHLLNNAIEASPSGVPVEIRLRQEAGRIMLDITDHGPGMTPEFVRDELFRPLSTSKAGGSGIGAWQARDLLTEAGGELTVFSRPGAGTTMRLVLPSVAHPAPAPALESSRL
jgi:signal transduction histidine kinase